MIRAPIPNNEAARLASLEKMKILSTVRDGNIDRITRTAQKYFKSEIALVSFSDKERQWFKSRCGIDATESPRDTSFCGHAILHDETLVVDDAEKDARFFDNPYVTGEPNVRFYAGQPLTNREGYRYGTLCIVSSQPRTFSDDDRMVLQDLGAIVETIIENQRLAGSQLDLITALAAAERDTMIDPLSGLWNRRGLQELFDREKARALREDQPFVIGIVDIDHFKTINDRFGHGIGDDAIRLTADLLARWGRPTDIVARIGGEEFAIIAPNVPASLASVLGARLLVMFRSHARIQTADGPIPYTVSLGMVASHPAKEGADTLKPLLDAADQMLYRAKQEGRNRCEIGSYP